MNLNDKICGVYEIRCIINNKVYIGSSINIKYRWTRHKRQLNKNNHHSIHLQRAWNKYGEENFEFNILEKIEDEDIQIRLKAEQKWMDKFQSYNYEFGYNISYKATGSCCLGERNPNYGNRWTDEQRKRMSESRKGIKLSEETRQKIIDWYKTHDHPMKGKTGELATCYGRTGDKHPMYGKRGSECPCSKKVICLNTGEIYDSARIASESTDTNYSKLCMCCRGKRKSSGKDKYTGEPLHWMYYNDYIINYKNNAS